MSILIYFQDELKNSRLEINPHFLIEIMITRVNDIHFGV